MKTVAKHLEKNIFFKLMSLLFFLSLIFFAVPDFSSFPTSLLEGIKQTSGFKPALFSNNNSPPGESWRMALRKGWYLQSAYLVRNNAAEISSSSFKPRGWIKAEVPTTVLAALVRNGVYPEPTVGLNNLRIPDANEEYNQKYKLTHYSHLPGKRNPWLDPYWFWTRFKLPSGLEGKHVWLNLEGINYRAEIWLNGRQVAGPREVAGMFGSWKLEITSVIFFDKSNTLAIKIFPLDYPGMPAEPQLRTFGSFGANGGPTGDIGKNVTMQCSIGWDWIPEVRDRNIGIWQPVSLSTTGPVDVANVMVSTTLVPNSSGQEKNIQANLTIKAELVNLEERPIKGILQVKITPPAEPANADIFIDPEAMTAPGINRLDSIRLPRLAGAQEAGIDRFRLSFLQPGSLLFPPQPASVEVSPGSSLSWEKEIELAAKERREIALAKEDWPELQIKNPKLWWPYDLGFPFLYELEFSFLESGKVSDREKIHFGLREISTRVATVNGWKRRDFFINGRRLFLRGGAWVPEMLLRREANPEWLLKELLLWRQANLNLVRLWGGGVTPTEDFFAICDRLGLLVWHDFWITGDCQATWGKGSRDWPLEAEIFLNNARATVLKLRHHPCLLLWTAGNEGYPRREIYTALRDEIIARLDGTRPFLPSSGYTEPPEDWGLSWPDNQPSGTYSGGPYWWVDPKEYYSFADRGGDWLFKNEVGLPSLPLLPSLKKFLPDLNPSPDLPFPLNHSWGFHDACEGNGKYSLYDRALRQRYGEPASLEDYVLKAQLINAENYRAIFEAANQYQEKIAGVVLWKTNSAWPSVMWQLYDYYLQPNAAFYFARRAGEPVQAQLDLRDRTVWVINHQLQRVTNLLLVADLYDLNGRKVGSRQEALEVEARTSQKLWPLELSRASFCLLRLLTNHQEKNDEGRLLTENYYWLSPSDDFRALQSLPRIRVQAEMEEMKIPRREKWPHLGLTPPARAWKIKIYNPTDKIGFFIFLNLLSGKGEPILPGFWEDNFLLLPPGESREVRVVVLAGDVKTKKIYGHLEGWNLAPMYISPKK